MNDALIKLMCEQIPQEENLPESAISNNLMESNSDNNYFEIDQEKSDCFSEKDYSDRESFRTDKNCFNEARKNRKSDHDRENHMCPMVREKLREWAIQFTIIQAVITALLIILSGVFPCLPLNAKTLISTKNRFLIETFCSENSLDKSEYAFIGISEQLQRIVSPKN